MAEFAVALGSNLGEREAAMRRAAEAIASWPLESGPVFSRVWEGPPAEGASGGSFLNAVAAGRYGGSAMELLDLCRAVERRLGSPVRKRGDARRMDVDLLLLGGTRVDTEELVLPHPGIARRLFVLLPLSEVWEGELPVLGATPESLVGTCPDPVTPEPVGIRLGGEAWGES